MKMSVALLDGGEKPVILYDGSSTQEPDQSDFVQILTGPLDVPGDDAISVSAALTLINQGCSLVVEQSGENILNLTFGVNYPPSVHIKLKRGNYAYISIDASEELE